MDVNLSERSEELVRQYLAQGCYRTPEEVVDRALQILSETERLGLDEKQASILELQGLGKAIWEGMDAQEYVDRERASWKCAGADEPAESGLAG